MIRYVQLALRQSTPKVIRVVASRDEPYYVLLGRDVLNDYRAIMDGPLLRLEIE